MTEYNKEVGEIVGLDLGDRYSQFCIVSRQGEIVERGGVATTATAMRKQFERGAPSRIALEAGTHSPWVSRLLEELGHEVLVANARKLRMIYDSDSKNDRADADPLLPKAAAGGRCLVVRTDYGPCLLLRSQENEGYAQLHDTGYQH